MKSPIEIILTFDLETTGLSATKNAITEIACSAMDLELNEISEYESGIIKPYDDRDINDKALEVTGITREQLKNGRDSKEVLVEFCKYLKSFKKTPAKIVPAGHNIDHFDLPFLADFFEFHKKDLSKFITDKVSIDTMWWARIKDIEKANYKLGTCCLDEDITLIDGHRALNDTRSNKDLVKRYIRNLRGDGSTVKVEEERPRDNFEF